MKDLYLINKNTAVITLLGYHCGIFDFHMHGPIWSSQTKILYALVAYSFLANRAPPSAGERLCLPCTNDNFG